MNFSRLYVLLFAISVFSSCNDIQELSDVDEVELSNDITAAVPLFYTESSVADAIDEDNLGDNVQLVYLGEDSVVAFSFQAQQTEVNIDDKIDITFDDILNIPMVNGVSNPVSLPLIEDPTIELDSMIYGAGTFDVSYKINGVPGDEIEFEFFFGNLKGFQHNATATIQAGQSSIESSINTDLIGKLIVPTNDSITLSYVAKKNGVEIVDPADLDVKISLKSTDYNTAYGYFEVADEVPFIKETIPFDALNEFGTDGFSFSDPSIEITIENGVGIPVGINIIDFSSVSSTGTNVSIAGDIVNTPPQVAFPSIPNVGNTVHDTININSSNSNLVDVMSNDPKSFFIEMNGDINPDQDRTVRGFVKKGSTVKASVDVNIPLKGTLENFNLTDTFDFDHGISASDVEDIKSAEVKFVIDNGIPVGINSQIYMYDDQTNSIIDSVYVNSSKLADAATYNADGSSSTTTTTDKVLLSESQISSLIKAEKVIINANISSFNNGEITISAKQKINARAGVKVVLNSSL